MSVLNTFKIILKKAIQVKWWWYSILLLIIGTVYLITTPPFQAPDESNHYFRAYQISDFGLVPIKKGDKTGGYIPQTVINDALQFNDLRFHPENKLKRVDWNDIYNKSSSLSKNNLSNAVFKEFSNTALYSPVPYIPQSIAITASKLFSLKTLTSLYLARFFNLLFYVLILSFAFKILEIDNKRLILLFFALAATPMALFEAASLSADGPTIALAFLSVALCFTLYKSWNKKYFVIFLITASLLCLCKNIYFLIPLTIIPTILFRSDSMKTKISRIISLASCTVIPIFLWGLAVKNIYSPVRDVVDMARQIDFVKAHVLEVLGIFTNEIIKNIEFYKETFIGKLGWLDTSLPKIIIPSYLFGLLALSFISIKDQYKTNVRQYLIQSLWDIVLIAASFLLICLSIYLSWNSVASPTLEGIQGRYFIPIAPLLFTIIPPFIKIKESHYNALNIIAIALWLCVSFLTFQALLTRYWI